MRRLLTLVGLSLVMGLSIASAAALAQPSRSNATAASAAAGARSHSTKSDWTLYMNFTPGSSVMYLKPLVKKGTKLKAIVKAGLGCNGKLSGTLKGTKLKAKMNFPGTTKCAALRVSMKGKMQMGDPGTGTTSGTFTASDNCTRKCTFTGSRTS